MTLAATVRRWPLHPPPSPGEALSSWVARLASPYGMTPGYLLSHCLGGASALLDDPQADDLDFDPPAGILQALAEQTGTDFGAVRLTTIAGWVPWLADTLEWSPTTARRPSAPTSGSTRCSWPRGRRARTRSSTGCPGYRCASSGGPTWWPARRVRPARTGAPACCPCCRS
ncbi:MAG: TniQ family protein [Streptosporangiaceae bacterium]|nr:TniQ family protein [Streptosporangiaceae bacterium]